MTPNLDVLLARRRVATLWLAGLFATAAWASGCGGCEDPNGFNELVPGLVLAADPIDFGQVYVGGRAERALALSNPGTAHVNVALSVEGASDFQLALDEHDLSIGPGKTRDIPVELRPLFEGSLEATLVVESDAAGKEETRVSLFGEAVLPPTCDDDNPCTSERFDTELGDCVVEVRDGQACDDGSACSSGDVCDGERCVGALVSCDDPPSECLVGYCDPLSGCAVVEDLRACDDGDPCTVDSCDAQLGCQHAPAVDGTPCGPFGGCRLDVCASGACVPIDLADGSPCFDGNPCSLDDHCEQGECVGTDPETDPVEVASVHTFGAQNALATFLDDGRLVFLDRLSLSGTPPRPFQLTLVDTDALTPLAVFRTRSPHIREIHAIGDHGVALVEPSQIRRFFLDGNAAFVEGTPIDYPGFGPPPTVARGTRLFVCAGSEVRRYDLDAGVAEEPLPLADTCLALAVDRVTGTLWVAVSHEGTSTNLTAFDVDTGAALVGRDRLIPARVRLLGVGGDVAALSVSDGDWDLYDLSSQASLMQADLERFHMDERVLSLSPFPPTSVVVRTPTRAHLFTYATGTEPLEAIEVASVVTRAGSPVPMSFFGNRGTDGSVLLDIDPAAAGPEPILMVRTGRHHGGMAQLFLRDGGDVIAVERYTTSLRALDPDAPGGPVLTAGGVHPLPNPMVLLRTGPGTTSVHDVVPAVSSSANLTGRLVDGSQPETPTFGAEIQLPNTAGIAASGGRMFVLHVEDTAMLEEWSLDGFPFTPPVRLAASEHPPVGDVFSAANQVSFDAASNRVATWVYDPDHLGAEVHLFDVTASGAPVLLGSGTLSVEPQRFSARGDRVALVTTNESGTSVELHTLALSPGGALEDQGTLPLMGTIELLYHDDHVLVLRVGEGIELIDPTASPPVSFYHLDLDAPPTDVAFVGDRLFIADQNRVQVMSPPCPAPLLP